MENIVNIGLIGFGTIGSGVVAILTQNLDLIEKKAEARIILKKIVDLDIKTPRNVKVNPEILSEDVNDIIDDPEIDIVIELIGGYEPALSFILKAMENGKHVITANKALIAKHWEQLMKSAHKNDVRICFEASVGGGIPILQPLNESLAANHIESIYGIINGTANYILTKMTEENSEFEDVLIEAQNRGYAEQDPTFDIEGFDTAQKLIILTVLGFGVYLRQEEFHVEGINKLTLEDIKFANNELGYIIKLLAIAKNVKGELEVRVHPTLIPKNHLLASVNNVFNGIYVVGDAIGPIMMYGQGAGMMPTASAVIGDCLDVIKNMKKKVLYGPQITPVKRIKEIKHLISKYYIRLTVIDKPGVLHKISGILSDYNISIESVNQNKRSEGQSVPIFMVTHEAIEKNISKAIKKIDKLDFIMSKTVFIRILDE
jgi:homoserine dehydrogenase